MNRDLLIAAGPGEWRAALLENGIPVELLVERGDRNEPGSIHLGRVCRLVSALGAALADIGGDRPAFLPQREVVPRGKRLDEGERVLVQVRREAQGGKAPRVTMDVTLRGRFVELVAGRPGVVGGEGLTPEERGRLLATVEPGPEPAGRGLRIIQPAPIASLTCEAAALARRWRDILDRATRIDPPARLDPIATFAAALAGALAMSPSRIIVDDPAAIPEIRIGFRGAAVECRPAAEWQIDLDPVFDEALSKTVALRRGGSVHIEATRAAVLVDVDTGTPITGSPGRIGLAVNLAAAETIARQVRLRNLGGGIVIDFVGLESRAARDRVCATLAEALACDPARPQILGWTRLGHLEMVRPRRGRPLADAFFEHRLGGGLIKTAITVAHEAVRRLRREAQAQLGRNWRLIVSPDVAAALADGAARALQEAEERFGRRILVETDPGYDRERFQIAPL